MAQCGLAPAAKNPGGRGFVGQSLIGHAAPFRSKTPGELAGGERANNRVKSRLRVLLVEDSAIARARMIEALEEHAVATIVGTAETEEEALAGIFSLKPDAVILDLQLREGSGLNVLRRLKLFPAGPRPKVIVFTSYVNPDMRYYVERQGAHYFVDKSLEWSHLEQLLRTLGEPTST